MTIKGFIRLMLRLAGKENFKLDERIGASYILRLCWKYGWMIIRGRFFALGRRNIANNIFIGRSVKVIEKSYLKIGVKSKLHDSVFIDALAIDGVILGEDVILGRTSRIECTGGLQQIGKGVVIGDRTTFANDCFFGAAGGIQIGKDVIAGQFIRFHSENHNYDDLSLLIKEQAVTHEGIKVGDNCWIGSGAVFLDGAEIGSGCVVAANAVVTKKFPDNAVLGGVPANIIKFRS